MSWSLENELCKLALVDDSVIALKKLGLVETELMSISRRDNEWCRGGAETYIYRFWITDSNHIEHGYILKACVAFSPGLTVEQILQLWLNRRALLSQHGVLTPRLFAHGFGTLLEELIPYELAELVKISGDTQHMILAELAHVAGVVTRLGFNPLSLFHDLRSRGSDVVVVDFGEDLGPAAVDISISDTLLLRLHQSLAAWGIITTPHNSTLMRSAFEGGLRSRSQQ